MDNKFGDIREGDTVPKVKETGSHIDYINQSLSPTANYQSDTITNLRSNIDNALREINNRLKKKEATQTETSKNNEKQKDNYVKGDKIVLHIKKGNVETEAEYGEYDGKEFEVLGVNRGYIIVDNEGEQLLINSKMKGVKVEKVEREDNKEDVITPISKGVFGNIYNQFKGKVKEAIDFLLNNKDGVAKEVLHHKDINGGIDLVYGTDTYGLKKIAEKHPEVLENLQEILDDMHIVSSSDNRIVLESAKHKAVVSKKIGDIDTDNWLLTAYEKKKGNETSVSSSDIETEPVGTGKRNGTATSQNSTSDSKGSTNSETTQTIGGKSLGEKIKDGSVYENGEEQTYDDLLDELENEEDVETFINNNISNIKTQITKAKKTKTTDIDKIKQEREKINTLEQQQDYWEKVLEVKTKRKREEQIKEVEEENKRKKE